MRVIRQDLFRSFSCGEEVQNEGDLNTRTPDTRFTETNVLVHGDPAEQRIHVSLLRLQDIVVYRRGAAVGVYLQIYNAGIDQTTLRPSVDVEYALIKDGKELGKMTEDWKGLSDSGQRLTLARLIDTRNLGVGEYEVAIRIRDRVSGQSLSPSQKFTVVQ